MKFRDFFENEIMKESNESSENLCIEDNTKVSLDEGVKIDPSNLLRDSNIKIKLVIPTNFGTEFVLAKKYPHEEISKALHGLKIEIKNNSVFVYN